MDGEQSHEQRIVELESNLEKAALFGKQLLEQLSLKSSESDDLLERCTRYEVQVDALKQKLHKAERDFDLAVAREKNALKEIDCLKAVCTDYETLEKEHNILGEKLRLMESEKQRRSQTITELEEHLVEVSTELSLAKTQIEEQKLLEKQRDRFTTSADDDDDHSDKEDHTNAFVSKVENLERELENLRTVLRQTVEDKELIVRQNLHNESRLEEALEEKSSNERQLVFYMNAVTEKNRQISELNEEIEVLKAAETDPNRRGNSIFAEVEDRRLEVEAKLVEARTRLKFAEESQRRLKVQLAHCYTSLQVMAAHSSKADQNYVRTLEREVMRLRAELSSAATRVAAAKADDGTYTEKDLQDNPLAGMLLTERRQNSVLKRKIEELIHQEGRRTQEMLRLGSDLRTSESEIEKLEQQRTILLMKLKEKEITDQNAENVSSPAAHTEVIKEVLVDVVQETERNKQNEQKLLAQEKNGEATHGEGASCQSENSDAKTFRGENQSKENLCPEVSDQKNVTVKTVNFGVDEQTEKPKQAPKPKGRQVTVVKRAKADNNDCKTQ